MRLRVDHHHVIHNGINNNAGATILKPEILNFEYRSHLASVAVWRASMPSIQASQLIFKNCSRS